MFKEITHNTLRKGEIKILHKFFEDKIDLDFLGAGLYATVYKFGPGKALRVDIIESERGWGSKIDETIYFDNEEEARQWVRDYNMKYNNKGHIPDWYMIAEYKGEVQ